MSARLSDGERAERAVTERDFQQQLTDLAEALGWLWAHWRPLQDSHRRWQVPVEGPLGKGWPDLTLVRVRDRRLIFAELKREREDLRPEQWQVMTALGSLVGSCRSHVGVPLLGVETHVWRPSDLRDPIEDSVIFRVLR